MRPITAVIAALISGSLLAQSKPTTPAIGSTLRTTILSALRPIWLAKVKKKSVLFKITTFRVLGSDAFISFEPLESNSSKYSWTGTPFEQRAKDGVLDTLSYALLRKDTKGWHVLDICVGPTDVAWSIWPETFKASKVLLGLP